MTASSFESGSVVQIFPTPVWTFKLRDAAPFIATLAERLYALRAADTRPVDVGFWQSTDGLHRDAAFEPLVERIHEAARAVLSLLDYDCELGITGMWGNIGGSARPLHEHTHPNNLLSGVLYVTTPKDSGATLFEDPRAQNRVLRPRLRRDNPLNALEFVYEGAAGTLLFFPAWLQHSVTPNRSAQDRITIAFNMMARGPLGTHDTFSFSDR